MVLRILSNNASIEDFINSSMITNEINNEFKQTEKIIEENNNKLETSLKCLKYEKHVRKYNDMLEKVETLKNKQRKKMLNEINILETQYPGVIKQLDKLKKINELEIETEKAKNYLKYMKTYVKDTIEIILNILKEEEFICNDLLSEKGIIATQIQEVHSLAMTNILHKKLFNSLCSSELAYLFSIFASHHSYTSSIIS